MFTETTTGLGGWKARGEGGVSYINYMHCGMGVKANRSDYMVRREETASLKPQIHRIQYIRSRGKPGNGKEIGPQVDEVNRRGAIRTGTDESDPSPNLYCCLHSSGFAVAPPPLPFPPFLGGGAKPSESESSSKASSSSSSMSS